MTSPYTFRDLANCRLDQEGARTELTADERSTLQAAVAEMVAILATTRVFDLSASSQGLLNPNTNAHVDFHITENQVEVTDLRTRRVTIISSETARGATLEEITAFNRLTQNVVEIGSRIWEEHSLHSEASESDEEEMLDSGPERVIARMTPVSPSADDRSPDTAPIHPSMPREDHVRIRERGCSGNPMGQIAGAAALAGGLAGLAYTRFPSESRSTHLRGTRAETGSYAPRPPQTAANATGSQPAQAPSPRVERPILPTRPPLSAANTTASQPAQAVPPRVERPILPGIQEFPRIAPQMADAHLPLVIGPHIDPAPAHGLLALPAPGDDMRGFENPLPPLEHLFDGNGFLHARGDIGILNRLARMVAPALPDEPIELPAPALFEAAAGVAERGPALPLDLFDDAPLPFEDRAPIPVDHIYMNDQQFLAAWQQFAPLLENGPAVGVPPGIDGPRYGLEELQHLAQWMREQYRERYQRELNIHIQPTGGNLPRGAREVVIGNFAGVDGARAQLGQAAVRRLPMPRDDRALLDQPAALPLDAVGQIPDFILNPGRGNPFGLPEPALEPIRLAELPVAPQGQIPAGAPQLFPRATRPFRPSTALVPFRAPEVRPAIASPMTHASTGLAHATCPMPAERITPVVERAQLPMPPAPLPLGTAMQVPAGAPQLFPRAARPFRPSTALVPFRAPEVRPAIASPMTHASAGLAHATCPMPVERIAPVVERAQLPKPILQAREPAAPSTVVAVAARPMPPARFEPVTPMRVQNRLRPVRLNIDHEGLAHLRQQAQRYPGLFVGGDVHELDLARAIAERMNTDLDVHVRLLGEAGSESAPGQLDRDVFERFFQENYAQAMAMPHDGNRATSVVPRRTIETLPAPSSEGETCAVRFDDLIIEEVVRDEVVDGSTERAVVRPRSRRRSQRRPHQVQTPSTQSMVAPLSERTTYIPPSAIPALPSMRALPAIGSSAPDTQVAIRPRGDVVPYQGGITHNIPNLLTTLAAIYCVARPFCSAYLTSQLDPIARAAVGGEAAPALGQRHDVAIFNPAEERFDFLDALEGGDGALFAPQPEEREAAMERRMEERARRGTRAARQREQVALRQQFNRNATMHHRETRHIRRGNHTHH